MSFLECQLSGRGQSSGLTEVCPVLRVSYVLGKKPNYELNSPKPSEVFIHSLAHFSTQNLAGSNIIACFVLALLAPVSGGQVRQGKGVTLTGIPRSARGGPSGGLGMLFLLRVSSQDHMTKGFWGPGSFGAGPHEAGQPAHIHSTFELSGLQGRGWETSPLAL